MGYFINMFDLVNNYIDQNATATYGDLKSGNTNDKIGQLLNGPEREMYYQIKQADNNRLMMSEHYQHQPLSNTQYNVQYNNQQSNTMMSGMGMVQQIC